MSDWLGVIAAAGAALGALVYIGRLVRRVVRIVDKVLELTETTAVHVDRELTPNHGSSMKDQQSQLPRDVARIERKVERIGEQVARAVAVSQATSRQVDAHIAQANRDRERLGLPPEGIDT